MTTKLSATFSSPAVFSARSNPHVLKVHSGSRLPSGLAGKKNFCAKWSECGVECSQNLHVHLVHSGSPSPSGLAGTKNSGAETIKINRVDLTTSDVLEVHSGSRSPSGLHGKKNLRVKPLHNPDEGSWRYCSNAHVLEDTLPCFCCTGRNWI